jgi:hypothetical protein
MAHYYAGQNATKYIKIEEDPQERHDWPDIYEPHGGSIDVPHGRRGGYIDVPQYGHRVGAADVPQYYHDHRGGADVLMIPQHPAGDDAKTPIITTVYHIEPQYTQESQARKRGREHDDEGSGWSPAIYGTEFRYCASPDPYREVPEVPRQLRNLKTFDTTRVCSSERGFHDLLSFMMFDMPIVNMLAEENADVLAPWTRWRTSEEVVQVIKVIQYYALQLRRTDFKWCGQAGGSCKYIELCPSIHTRDANMIASAFKSVQFSTNKLIDRRTIYNGSALMRALHILELTMWNIVTRRKFGQMESHNH